MLLGNTSHKASPQDAKDTRALTSSLLHWGLPGIGCSFWDLWLPRDQRVHELRSFFTGLFHSSLFSAFFSPWFLPLIWQSFSCSEITKLLQRQAQATQKPDTEVEFLSTWWCPCDSCHSSRHPGQNQETSEQQAELQMPNQLTMQLSCPHFPDWTGLDEPRNSWMLLKGLLQSKQMWLPVMRKSYSSYPWILCV